MDIIHTQSILLNKFFKKKKKNPFYRPSLSLCLSALSLSLSLSKHLLQCHSLMVAMVVSLLVSSLPLLIALGDVLVPFVLISSFTCIECYGLKEHLRWYAFKSSLIDIPLVSVVRSDCTFSDIPLVSFCPMISLSVRSLIFRSWIVIFVSLVP